jgi:hypothetical protein
MKIHTGLILALGALSASALDLTPNFVTTVADGVAIRRPYFTDSGKKYSVTLNVETDLSAYEDGALFRFIKLSRAEMRLRLSPVGVEVKFAPDTIDRYLQAARKLLPQDAEEVVLDQQTPNPLPINGWQGHRFIYTYQSPSGQVRQSITFLNILPNQQVVVQVSSMAKDFADASERAYDIIRRWHELDADTILRGN